MTAPDPTAVPPARLSTRPVLVLAGAAAVVMASAQIAIPLTTRHAGLSSAVVVALAACAVAAATATWGLGRATIATVLVAPTALVAELVGTRTGWPFGAYRYLGALRPTIAGVPAIVPLAWLGMGLAAWELAGRLAHQRVTRVAVGAAALTAWDLFLDPQMTRERYWVWSGGGVYRNVPVSNYLGWLACSVLVMGLFSISLPGERRSLALLGLFTWTAVMETLGFFVFFGDPLVGAVGGAATLPLVALAWARRRPGASTTVLTRHPGPIAGASTSAA